MIGAPEAYELMRRGEAVILDVREMHERRAARIPGTLHIPLHELPQRVDEVPRDRTVVCQCASGMRSAAAVGLLLRAGHADVRNMRMGMIGWHMAGLPVEAT